MTTEQKKQKKQKKKLYYAISAHSFLPLLCVIGFTAQGFGGVYYFGLKCIRLIGSLSGAVLSSRAEVRGRVGWGVANTERWRRGQG